MKKIINGLCKNKCVKKIKKCCHGYWPKAIVFVGIVLLVVYFKSYFVVAWVNNQPVWRISYVKELEKQAGKQILETMITKSLITQEAKKQNITVTEEEIKTEMARIEAIAEKQQTDLDELLEQQGLTREQLINDIVLQKQVEKLAGKEVVVSDEEVTEYLTTNAEYLPETEDQETLKTSVKQQLLQQKTSQKIQDWITELQDNAKIIKWF